MNLFDGISLKTAEHYVSGIKTFKAGEHIVRAGEEVNGFKMVTEGTVQVYSEDYFGNRNIISRCKKGELFLEAVSLTRPESSPVNVQAVTDCTVAEFEYPTIFSSCGDCASHARILENLLTVLSTKVLSLNRKINILSKRTIRDKVLSYLKEEGQGAKKITIPFTREELANYLYVDRSALSRELSNMKKRGEIDFKGKQFTIKVNNVPLD